VTLTRRTPVYTHVRRVESYLETLVYTHCVRLILFACIICVWFLPEFCVILPMLEHCFFLLFDVIAILWFVPIHVSVTCLLGALSMAY